MSMILGDSMLYLFAASRLFSPGLVLGLGVATLIFFGLLIVEFAATWRIYTKAGKRGWAALVPFYNTWVMAEIAGKPGWWGLYPLLGLIPILGAIAGIAVSIVIAIGVARNFGKSDVFGFFGLWLFSVIGIPMLGFGPDVYMPVHGQASTIR